MILIMLEELNEENSGLRCATLADNGQRFPVYSVSISSASFLLLLSRRLLMERIYVTNNSETDATVDNYFLLEDIHLLKMSENLFSTLKMLKLWL